MKTIRQRAREYANYTICKGNEEAFAVGAISILDELKTVMSVSEDEYLRTNLEKMIDLLEDREREEMYKQHFEDFFKHKK